MCRDEKVDRCGTCHLTLLESTFLQNIGMFFVYTIAQLTGKYIKKKKLGRLNDAEANEVLFLVLVEKNSFYLFYHIGYKMFMSSSSSNNKTTY